MVVDRSKSRWRNTREDVSSAQAPPRCGMHEAARQTDVNHERRMPTITCCRQSWAKTWMGEPDVTSGSHDTIDDSLSGCDSETDEGTGYVRQQTADKRDSRATTQDDYDTNPT